MSEQGIDPRPDDEIDLRELVSIVIDRWYWIAIGLVTSAIAGVGYALSQEREYETEFRAIEAASSQFNTLNEMTRVTTATMAQSGVTEITGFQLEPARVREDLTNRLNSFQNFEAFVQNSPGLIELEPEQSMQQYFAERFSINTTDAGGLRATFVYNEGMPGPELLNTYINETAERLWLGYLETIRQQNLTTIRRLENRLEDQVAMLIDERQQRLFELRQAATIARRLSIELPTTPGQLGRQTEGSQVMYANISSGEDALPLYFFGYQALEAEAEIVSESLDEGLVNEAILQTQEALAAQRRLARLIESSEFIANTGLGDLRPAERLTTVLDYAIEPDFPTGTSRLLIVIVSVFIGGFLGFMMTFISHFTKSVKAYRKSQRA
ncbi:MAG: Wzz/FepE/Etk N-terminal domain-containing protein [Saccharospirillum sp.]